MPENRPIVEFERQGRASVINYDVPLPTQHSGRRITELGDIPDIWKPEARDAGIDVKEELDLKREGDGFTFDEAKVSRFFRDHAALAGFSNDQISRAEDFHGRGFRTATEVLSTIAIPVEHRWPVVSDVNAEPPTVEARNPKILDWVGSTKSGLLQTDLIAAELAQSLGEFRDRLRRGEVLVPTASWGGTPTGAPVDAEQTAEPMLLIVEEYGISSFLGDYGLGRTVKTFTLLPGESTTIALRTWKSSRSRIESGSSIIDSMERSTADKFAETVRRRTTDRRTSQNTHKWHAEGAYSSSLGANFSVLGIGASSEASFRLALGASGEYHSEREQFAETTADTVREHASEASAAREVTVTSQSERTQESGEEETIERVIKNVNMRRVLNFVFREMNQEYITKVHLKDVRVAFTNGRPNSWREVPLSGLRKLLRELVVEERVTEVAQAVLKLVGVAFDHADEPVTVIESITIDESSHRWTRSDATLDSDGNFPAPTDRTFYRFKRGPISQSDQAHRVDGVLLKERRITLRTDSVVVEALLGQAEALDAYAMEIQGATAGERTLRNEQLSDELAVLREIGDPVERVAAYDRLFNIRPNGGPE